MSFQIVSDPFDREFAHFSRRVREALQKTFAEEVTNGLTQKELADTLGVNESVISRRLNSLGNVTLRTLCDLYVAMGRDPLSNFDAPKEHIVSPEIPSSGQTDVIGKIDLSVPVSSLQVGITKRQTPSLVMIAS